MALGKILKQIPSKKSVESTKFHRSIAERGSRIENLVRPDVFSQGENKMCIFISNQSFRAIILPLLFLQQLFLSDSVDYFFFSVPLSSANSVKLRLRRYNHQSFQMFPVDSAVLYSSFAQLLVMNSLSSAFNRWIAVCDTFTSANSLGWSLFTNKFLCSTN